MDSSPKIIELIQERLNKGKKDYGQELPIDDGRDWTIEALEELLDIMVYLANYILIKKEHEKSFNTVNLLKEFVHLREKTISKLKDVDMRQEKTE